jgi:peptidoglycan/xylan/chitin deacetylase (PgdA/CDA1 family)
MYGKLRRTLRTVAENLAAQGHLGRAYVRLRRVAGATILMYHSVSRPGLRRWMSPGTSIEAEKFEAHLAQILSKRRVISLSELVTAIEGGRTLPAGTVVLTFDDGYVDNLRVAAPILVGMELPATFYLPTGLVSRGESPWVDRLCTALALRRNSLLDLGTIGAGRFDLDDRAQGGEAYRVVHDRLLIAGRGERGPIFAELEAQLRPSGQPPRLTMSWDEVRELAGMSPGFEIGAHTQEHLDLCAHTGAIAREEVAGCVADVEREVGRRPEHFSFPYGRWCEETVAVVRESGFRSAVADGGDVLITGETDRYCLGRVDCPRSVADLLYKTSGAYPGLERALGRDR